MSAAPHLSAAVAALAEAQQSETDPDIRRVLADCEIRIGLARQGAELRRCGSKFQTQADHMIWRALSYDTSERD